ncbi:MAG: type IX secretion system protein PorQ [Muribaculaceae bacterium]|nr:type IX secretion system protein PorQ [Muribaculaceae bacterium]
MQKMLRNIRYTILTTLVLLLSLCAGAQDGSTSYSFLNIPSSTLAYGLGGINISNIDDDINAADRNPGLLGSEMEMQLGVNYMRYIGDSNFAGVKFGKAAGEHGAWAAGIQYFGYGTIKGADINGVLTGDISPKDMVFTGTYAHDITERWRGGASIKFVYSSYDAYSAFAIATDLGVNYYDPDRDFSFSAMVANLGGQVKRFNERYDHLPIDIRLGMSKSFGTLPIVFSVTAWNLTKWKLPYWHTGDGTENSKPELKDSFGSNLFRHLIFGADFSPSDNFRIGLGYNYKTRTDMSTYKRSLLSGFSASLGLKVRNFGLGLAMAQPHSGATTIMLNISTNLYEFSR